MLVAVSILAEGERIVVVVVEVVEVVEVVVLVASVTFFTDSAERIGLFPTPTRERPN